LTLHFSYNALFLTQISLILKQTQGAICSKALSHNWLWIGQNSNYATMSS